MLMRRIKGAIEQWKGIKKERGEEEEEEEEGIGGGIEGGERRRGRGTVVPSFTSNLRRSILRSFACFH